jgi:hypothetical protein
MLTTIYLGGSPSTMALLIVTAVLTGCVTIVCDPDDPEFGKDCYECTRKATFEAQQAHPHTGNRVKDLTEVCLRERGYVRQKKGDMP